MKDVLDYLNDSDKIRITDELAKYIAKFKDNKDLPEGRKFGQVDFQYDISQGKIQDEGRANTFLAFDIEKSGILHEFIKATYARDMSEDELKKLGVFVNEICRDLATSYSVTLKESIRGAVIPSTEEWAVPLDNIKILLIDMVDYSAVENPYLLKIKKSEAEDINAESVIKRLQSLSEELPGKSYAEIIEEQKEKGDEMFQHITGITKYIWDVSVALFVDYSLSDTFIKQQENVPR